jgi:uncharacterized protein (TIGR01777 family)
MRVALLGASGFVGSSLATRLRARGDEVVALSLRDPAAAAADAAGCDAIVNVAGEKIAQRWTGAIKQRIADSRTTLPREFLARLASLSPRAGAYVSASAVGYYGSTGDAQLDESSPPGDNFLARICIEWEQTAQRAASLGMRVSCIRTGLVLGNGDGVLAKMLPLFRAGLGGRYGNGRQWYSWIHVDDLCAIYALAIDGMDAMSGTLNATAPNPVRNAEFAEILARTVRRPAIFPTPSFVLRLALGEGATAVLGGQRVLPKRLQQLGYQFEFPGLEAAISSLVAR